MRTGSPRTAAADWLHARFPRLYRLARPAWRRALEALGQRAYFERRRGLRYYQEVERLARAYAPTARSALDVGAGESEVLLAMPWIAKRIALDRRVVAARPGIEAVMAEFLEYEPPCRFDLVLCLQVLEHLHEPVPFVDKLFGLGDCVILSVPYRWPAGLQPQHPQDPVDERKLAAWTGRVPVASTVVADARDRLVAVYSSGSSSEKASSKPRLTMR